MQESTNFNGKRNKGGKPATKMRQKGTNILITDVGNHVRLIDFGFADTDAYLAKNIGTTPSIQSPEQSDASASTADIQRDIYALGKILADLFPHRFHFIRKRCLKNRYSAVRDVRAALRRHTMFRWLLPLAGIGLIAVLAVAGWLRTMPVESTLAMQKDTVVIVTQVSVPPAMPADSAWLKFEHRAETAYTNAYLMAKDSLANMVPRDYYAAYTIFNNYAVNVYYLREQFVASNPEYEEQFMEHYVRIYERDYTRLYRILVRDFPYSQE